MPQKDSPLKEKMEDDSSPYKSPRRRRRHSSSESDDSSLSPVKKYRKLSQGAREEKFLNSLKEADQESPVKEGVVSLIFLKIYMSYIKCLRSFGYSLGFFANAYLVPSHLKK